MWVPTDSILEGATRVMPNLIEESFQRHRVLLATPVTMIALLSGVAAALHQEEQQEKLHRNALEIQQAGERLYNGVRRHAAAYETLGKRLNSTLQAYDAGVSSIQGNLLQGAKQMRELGGGEGEEPTEPEELRSQARSFTSRELRNLAEAERADSNELAEQRAFEKLSPDPESVQLTAANETPRQAPTTDSESAAPRRGPGRQTERPVSGSRPSSFRLWDEEYPVRSNRDVLLGVANLLYQEDPDEFELSTQLHGRTRQYVSRSEHDHTHPLRVGDSDYWIEGNHSANDAIALAQRLLDHLGYSSDELEVLYR